MKTFAQTFLLFVFLSLLQGCGLLDAYHLIPRTDYTQHGTKYEMYDQEVKNDLQWDISVYRLNQDMTSGLVQEGSAAWFLAQHAQQTMKVKWAGRMIKRGYEMRKELDEQIGKNSKDSGTLRPLITAKESVDARLWTALSTVVEFNKNWPGLKAKADLLKGVEETIKDFDFSITPELRADAIAPDDPIWKITNANDAPEFKNYKPSLTYPHGYGQVPGYAPQMQGQQH